MKRTFQVWHATPHNFFGDADFAQRWPVGYVHVADVETEHRHEVFKLTNHIDTDWLHNEGVTRALVACARSTSVGDIVVDKSTDAKAMVDWIGYKELP